MKSVVYLVVCSFLVLSCTGQINNDNQSLTPDNELQSDTLSPEKTLDLEIDTTYKTIHIYVALCDNEFQGIVPVPPKIGNGQDADNNLYWGCAYGIRTFFKRSNEWKFVESRSGDSHVLERVIFKHASKNYYLVADAYDGRFIKRCTEEFLRSSSGLTKNTIDVDGKTIGIAGYAELVSYIGHDGLMDFQLTESFDNQDGIERSTVILACYSKSYFSKHLRNSNVNPLVWSTGLMSPEAYTVHDAISGFVKGERNDEIRVRAAAAYSKYQKCSLNAAKNLLVTGW